MNVKGTLTIERIKDIVGEIMSSCAGKMKFEILEVIMKGVVFEKKKLREKEIYNKKSTEERQKESQTKYARKKQRKDAALEAEMAAIRQFKGKVEPMSFYFSFILKCTKFSPYHR